MICRRNKGSRHSLQANQHPCVLSSFEHSKSPMGFDLLKRFLPASK
jgi:hypothetical protein